MTVYASDKENYATAIDYINGQVESHHRINDVTARAGIRYGNGTQWKVSLGYRVSPLLMSLRWWVVIRPDNRCDIFGFLGQFEDEAHAVRGYYLGKSARFVAVYKGYGPGHKSAGLEKAWEGEK